MKISDNEAHSATYRSENEHFARRCRHYKSKDCKAESLSLESSVKTIGINLSEDVYNDLRNCDRTFDILDEKIEKTTHYILRYITVDYLLDEKNIKQFVRLASESNWLPHYYNALYFALKRERNDKKVDQVFQNLSQLVCDGKPSDNWRALDTFIRNAFQHDVLDDYQTRFLKYIRKHLFSPIDN